MSLPPQSTLMKKTVSDKLPINFNLNTRSIEQLYNEKLDVCVEGVSWPAEDFSMTPPNEGMVNHNIPSQDITTPEVYNVPDEIAVELYPPTYNKPEKLIQVEEDPNKLDIDVEFENVPDYDLDSEDERWLFQQEGRLNIDLQEFEMMMNWLEKHSSRWLPILSEAHLILGNDVDDYDTITVIYNYWLQKRSNSNSLTPQVKTKVGAGSVDNDNPYVAFRHRGRKMTKKRKHNEESYKKMVILRNNLAHFRAIFQKMVEREKRVRDKMRSVLERLDSSSMYQVSQLNGSTSALPEVSASSSRATIQNEARPIQGGVAKQNSIKESGSSSSKNSVTNGCREEISVMNPVSSSEGSSLPIQGAVAKQNSIKKNGSSSTKDSVTNGCGEGISVVNPGIYSEETFLKHLADFVTPLLKAYKERYQSKTSAPEVLMNNRPGDNNCAKKSSSLSYSRYEQSEIYLVFKMLADALIQCHHKSREQKMDSNASSKLNHGSMDKKLLSPKCMVNNKCKQSNAAEMCQVTISVDKSTKCTSSCNLNLSKNTPKRSLDNPLEIATSPDFPPEIRSLFEMKHTSASTYIHNSASGKGREGSLSPFYSGPSTSKRHGDKSPSKKVLESYVPTTSHCSQQPQKSSLPSATINTNYCVPNTHASNSLIKPLSFNILPSHSSNYTNIPRMAPSSQQAQYIHPKSSPEISLISRDIPPEILSLYADGPISASPYMQNSASGKGRKRSISPSRSLSPFNSGPSTSKRHDDKSLSRNLIKNVSLECHSHSKTCRKETDKVSLKGKGVEPKRKSEKHVSPHVSLKPSISTAVGSHDAMQQLDNLLLPATSDVLSDAIKPSLHASYIPTASHSQQPEKHSLPSTTINANFHVPNTHAQYIQSQNVVIPPPNIEPVALCIKPSSLQSCPPQPEQAVTVNRVCSQSTQTDPERAVLIKRVYSQSTQTDPVSMPRPEVDSSSFVQNHLHRPSPEFMQNGAYSPVQDYDLPQHFDHMPQTGVSPSPLFVRNYLHGPNQEFMQNRAYYSEQYYVSTTGGCYAGMSSYQNTRTQDNFNYLIHQPLNTNFIPQSEVRHPNFTSTILLTTPEELDALQQGLITNRYYRLDGDRFSR